MLQAQQSEERPVGVEPRLEAFEERVQELVDNRWPEPRLRLHGVEMHIEVRDVVIDGAGLGHHEVQDRNHTVARQ